MERRTSPRASALLREGSGVKVFRRMNVAGAMNKARYDSAFVRLAKSKFRSRFHLSEADRRYIAEKGMVAIRSHCEDFIRTRLAPADPPNDGKQTPMRGHPVFKAQHACACCCRGCLAKWWKVPRGVEISVERQRGIVDFLMAWIERDGREMKRFELKEDKT